MTRNGVSVPSTVLVSGAGITGLTLACALRRYGIDVEVIEAKAQLIDDGGVGLTLMSNALRALDSVGLARALMDGGVCADYFRVCDLQGGLVHKLPTPMPGIVGLPGHCSLSRRFLHHTLADIAQQAGARIRTGRRIERSEVSSDGLDVVFDDGSHGRYLLCAAAEGLFSAARARLFPDVKIAASGQGGWRARVRRPAGLDTSEVYLTGPYGIVGICPISEAEAYLYVIEAAAEGHREDDALAHQTLRRRLEGHYGGRVAPLLEQLVDPAQVNYRPLPGLLIPAPWFSERTVLMGDAAHANPPVLAQGAAMGIEDAVVLAEELHRHGKDVDAAVAAFMQRRFERARAVVETSLQLSRWQTEHTPGVDFAGVIGRVTRLLAEPI